MSISYYYVLILIPLLLQRWSEWISVQSSVKHWAWPNYRGFILFWRLFYISSSA